MRTLSGTLLVLAITWLAVSGAREYRTSDGSGNNRRRSNMGATGELQIRLLPSHLPNITSPNVRSVSNRFGADTTPVNGVPNVQGVNLFEAFYGQFVNHDRQFSQRGTFFYTIPLLDGTSDPFYTENGTNNFILIRESVMQQVPIHGQSGSFAFEFPNQATAWLDLSCLYGNNDAQFAAMRTGNSGSLKTSNYTVQLGPFPTVLTNQLPSKELTGLPVQTTFNAGPANIVSAGDPRAAENVALSIITTVFLREHNRLAAAFAVANPTWDDDKLFQEARRINIAQYQNILVSEYLPVIAAPDHLRVFGKYTGYKKNTEGGTSLEFSTVAFRYGHSAISGYLMLNASLCPRPVTVPAGVFGPAPLTLTELPFAGQVGGPFTTATAMALAGGEQNILRGLLNTPSQTIDTRISDTLRNSRPPGLIGPGIDLFSSDVLRGRLHGMPTYDSLRLKYFSMPGQDGEADLYDVPDCIEGENTDSIECFLAITSNATLAAELRDVYGRVTEIDAIVGLLAEDHIEDSFLPRTAANIIMKEYKRMRAADRFWFEANGVLTSDELALVKNRTFAAIVRDAYPGLVVQDDIFHVGVSPLPVC